MVLDMSFTMMLISQRMGNHL